jgi:hypothetical protein
MKANEYSPGAYVRSGDIQGPFYESPQFACVSREKGCGERVSKQQMKD